MSACHMKGLGGLQTVMWGKQDLQTIIGMSIIGGNLKLLIGEAYKYDRFC